MHITRTLLRKMLYSSSSNHNLSNMVTQFDFLTSLVAKLKDPAAVDEVIGTMATVRDKLVVPDNIRVTMGTNVNNVANPLEPWKNFTPTNRYMSLVIHTVLFHYGIGIIYWEHNILFYSLNQHVHVVCLTS